jgi:two-component system KDP operon response regulator KdpE
MQTLRPSVLLLDPFDDEREMYTTYLRALGFAVWPHERTAEAAHTLAAENPDALILRLRQSKSGIGGIDFVREIRRTRSTDDLAIIMITTSILPEDGVAASRAGVDAYLLLPVHPDEIVAEVRRLLRRVPPSGAASARLRRTHAARSHAATPSRKSRR